jgi:hypothetical protein
MADDRVTGALEFIQEQVQKLQADIARQKRLANSLAVAAGMDAIYTDIEDPETVGTLAAIRSDQFANYTYPSEAARAFLTMRGSTKGAAELDVIFDALHRGGFAWGSAKNDPKGGLRIALGKDGQVRRLPNGSYGLWEWYPNAKRDKKKGSASDDDDDEASEEQPEAPPGEGTKP